MKISNSIKCCVILAVERSTGPACRCQVVGASRHYFCINQWEDKEVVRSERKHVTKYPVGRWKVNNSHVCLVRPSHLIHCDDTQSHVSQDLCEMPC